MNKSADKPKRKRPSKGQRKHNRLVKQEARKASVPGNDANKRKVAGSKPAPATQSKT